MNKEIDVYTGSCLRDQEPALEQLIADYVRDTVKNKSILEVQDIINCFHSSDFQIKIVMGFADINEVAKRLNIPS